MFATTAFAIYQKAIRTQWDKYAHPNWPPTTLIQLGDYGRVLTDGTFQRLGNLADLGILLQAATDPGKAEIAFSTAGHVALKPQVAATGQVPQGPQAGTQATIKFTSRQAVFLKASGVRGIHLANYAQVGQQLIQRLARQKWRQDYVVVTKVYQAERGTLAIANTKRAGGEIDFQVQGTAAIEGVADLLAADIGLTIQHSRNVSFASHFETGSLLLGFSTLVRATFTSQPVEFLPQPSKGSFFGGSDQDAVHIYPPVPTQAETHLSFTNVIFG
jgi:hypothetical protein